MVGSDAVGSDAADAQLAAELATDAGHLLVELRAGGAVVGDELGRLGDQRANDLLLARLAAQRPDDSVLSEESVDDRSRLNADRVWIIDPLDGTREYQRPGRRDWAVHVALWRRGLGLTVGAVALPALGVTYCSASMPPGEPPTGTLPIDELLPAANSPRPRVVISSSRPVPEAAAVASAIGAQVVHLGSAGAKAMAVVRGEAQVYIHSGGQSEWDSAAPVAVALAVGLWCSRVDGTPLEYNRSDVYLPDLLICRPELVPPILAAIT
ncbi:3'(2'),5'-bisphosphate nucleotidase CysQ [Williamsia sp. CHRR-6]|uniref:3'(2'),5'-bisphosphate nucleotidase CysQ n=1 Tax=Williamsia sp. CHRR-6 TaxID=2835871 RepID=UPI001BD93877|nr:3'(2'),5'-bisphosphate nucleotidase CysQ [Williamsia sp. CHRR-6]MBT0568555.1 3'(2'),5'-bisphosphate nucleotidase CysQ [Williamsia sp. CHRR-6]